jgi:CO/xanthine dehydrogenase Mo-binding subunit
VCREIGYHGRSHDSSGPIRRGMGLSIGFKDGGGVNKPAQARVKVSTGGDVFLQCGTVEIGQGARTALSQITAEILGVPLERVSYAPINTDYLPFDQGTNASSGIPVMGQAVARAAEAVKRQLLEFAAAQLGADIAQLQLDNGSVLHEGRSHALAPMVMRYFGGTGFEFSADGFFKAPSDHHAPLEAPCVFWEIGWGAAEVEVDIETGLVRVLKLVASGDAGRAIHPLMCKGQENGAAVMGLAQALFEHMVYDDQGRLLNSDPLTYRVALAEDLPEHFTTITQEQGHGPGPFGSKGAGEGTILPIASAIANAVHDAVGIRITELPITPVRVLEALTKEESKP